MARDASVAKAGYFPLDAQGFDDIVSILRVGPATRGSQGQVNMLDPCAGQGESLRLARALGRQYLDAAAADDTGRVAGRHRAEGVNLFLCELEDGRSHACTAAVADVEAETKRGWLRGGTMRREVVASVATGDAFCLPALGTFGHGAYSPWVSLLYLNPPYSPDLDGPAGGRIEQRWLERFTAHAAADATLVFVVPLGAVRACVDVLARAWCDVQIGRVRVGAASAAFAATQVVVLARRLLPELTAPDVLARGRIEAMVARGVDALPGVHELSVMTVPEVGDRSPTKWAWKVDTIDIVGACTEHVPWHRSARRPAAGARRPVPLVPLREALPTDRTWAELSARSYPTLMQLKPSYVADAIASGALDGELVVSTAGDAPPVYVKGMFDRRFREVEVKYDSKGEARASVQVQRPSLRVSVLDPHEGRVYVLGDSALPSGSAELSGFTVGDLVSRYGPSLAAALGRRCPVIEDTSRDHEMRPLRILRPLYTAQAAAVRASARHLLLRRAAVAATREGTPAVLLQGQPGTGKTAMSLSIAQTIGARRALVVCPPHLVSEEAAWCSDAVAVLGPLADVHVLSSVIDLAAYEAATAASIGDGDDGRMHIAVCSREVAKLGHGHDAVARGACPRCGVRDTREPGKLVSTRARCKAPALRPTGPRRLQRAAGELARALAWCSPSPIVSERLPPGSACMRWRDARGDDLDGGKHIGDDAAWSGSRFVRAPAATAAQLVLAYVTARERASATPGKALTDAQGSALSTLRAAANDMIASPGNVTAAERLLTMVRAMAPMVAAGRVVRPKPGTGDGFAHPGVECGEPLYQASPRPRRWPLVRALVEAAKRGAFDLLVLDEAHEYGNYDSAQAQAAERLVAAGIPVVFATGTVCNGYMSSMHAFFRVLSTDYARDFARNDRPAAVARFGYQRRQVDLRADGTPKDATKASSDDVELGAVSDRVVKGGVKITGQAPGILPEALLRYLAPATAQVHLDDLGVDLPPISDVRIDVAPTDVQAQGLRHLADALVKRIRDDRKDPARAGKLFGQFSGLPSFLDRCVLQPEWVVSYPAPTPAAAKRGERGDEVARLPAPPLTLPPATEVLPKETALCEWIVGQLRRGRPCLVYVWHWDLLPRIADAIRTALATADLSPPGEIKLGAGVWRPGSPDGDDKRLSPTVVNVSVLDPGKVPPVKREAWIGKAAAARNAVLLTNPAAVKTGINSLARWWASAAWFEGPGCSPEIRRQATHRLHRIGQQRDVEVVSFVYSGTMQAALHELLLSKVGVSEAVDGLDASAALTAAGVGEGDALASLEVGRALYAWCAGDRR